MRKFVDWRFFGAGIAICAIVALGVAAVANLPFLSTFAIVVAAMLLNGLVAELEDRWAYGIAPSRGEKLFYAAARAVGALVVVGLGSILFFMTSPPLPPLQDLVVRGSLFAMSLSLAAAIALKTGRRVMIWVAGALLVAGLGTLFLG